jgi:hypothetical protein
MNKTTDATRRFRLPDATSDDSQVSPQGTPWSSHQKPPEKVRTVPIRLVRFLAARRLRTWGPEMRRILAAGLAAVTLVVGARVLVGAVPHPANVPASTVFEDSAGMRILSDGGMAYAEGRLNINCVRSWFNPAVGASYFRTASNTFCDYINGQPFGTIQRQVRLDFTFSQSESVAGHVLACPGNVEDPFGNTLDLCGLNAIPDLQLIASDLFKSDALETPVTISFNLYPSFVNDTSFMLKFLQPIPISAVGASRRLRAPSTAIAELSVRRAKSGESVWVPVAQYYVPFSLTVTPCPMGGC